MHNWRRGGVDEAHSGDYVPQQTSDQLALQDHRVVVQQVVQ
jgi:hypothetical protein